MKKDFDEWNTRKKYINENGVGKFYAVSEIWWCTLGTNIGFEQDGKGWERERPVLILRGFNLQVCIVVPLTTSQKKNMYHLSVGEISGKQNFVIISQIRLIDTRRLTNRIAILDSEIFQGIRKAVRNLF